MGVASNPALNPAVKGICAAPAFDWSRTGRKYGIRFSWVASSQVRDETCECDCSIYVEHIPLTFFAISRYRHKSRILDTVF